jgi:hypothetical protein
MVLRSSVAISGFSAVMCSTRCSGRISVVRGPATAGIVVARVVAPARPRGHVEDQRRCSSPGSARPLSRGSASSLHRRAGRSSGSRTWMCAIAAPASAASRQAVRRSPPASPARPGWFSRVVEIAGHGAGDEDFRLHHRCLPPSTTIFGCRSRTSDAVAQARRSPRRRPSGLGQPLERGGRRRPSPCKLLARGPARTAVSTAPGDTTMTLTSGARAPGRANSP